MIACSWQNVLPFGFFFREALRTWTCPAPVGSFFSLIRPQLFVDEVLRSRRVTDPCVVEDIRGPPKSPDILRSFTGPHFFRQRACPRRGTLFSVEKLFSFISLLLQCSTSRGGVRYRATRFLWSFISFPLSRLNDVLAPFGLPLVPAGLRGVFQGRILWARDYDGASL